MFNSSARRGPQGLPGPPGKPGHNVTGPRGRMGFPGLKGLKGDTGKPGPKGATGDVMVCDYFNSTPGEIIIHQVQIQLLSVESDIAS